MLPSPGDVKNEQADARRTSSSSSAGAAGPGSGTPVVGNGDFKRAYQACIPCRQRKQKCDLGDLQNPTPPCARCRRSSKKCTFTERRSDVPPSRKRSRAGSATPVVESPNPKIETKDIIRTGLSNANDALNLLYEASSRVREISTLPWQKSKYVRQKLMTAEEVQAHVEYFRNSLLPLSPITTLPNLQHEELLLAVILTIASRYFTTDSVIRSSTIHERLFRDLQSSLMDLVWGGSANRTVGSVYGLLFITEWHPRAIHFSQEPATERADNASWMLLGVAATLSQVLRVEEELRNTLCLQWNMLSARLGYDSLGPPASSSKTVGLDLLLKLVTINKDASKALFRSSECTRDLVVHRTYPVILAHFAKILEAWWHRFTRATVQSPMRELILIEHEYNQIYINSLALQASLEHSVVLPQDQVFVKRVVTGCTNLLHIITTDTFPLRNAPVRVFTRIISAAVFLLKSLALPQTEPNLSLLRATSRCMRTKAVDDVHISNKYATMLDELISRVEVEGIGPRRGGSTEAVVDWSSLFGDVEGMEFMDFLMLQ